MQLKYDCLWFRWAAYIIPGQCLSLDVLPHSSSSYIDTICKQQRLAMAIQHLLLIVFMVYILQAATSDTAYDLLAKNNFPRALLPLGVKSYVNHDGGAVEVTLPASCDFNVTVAGGSHKIRFDSIVSGVIQPGSITQLGRRQDPVWVAFSCIPYGSTCRWQA